MALEDLKSNREKMLHVLLLFPEFCGLSDSVNTPVNRQLLAYEKRETLAFDQVYHREKIEETKSQEMREILMKNYSDDFKMEQIFNAFQYDHVFSHWLILRFLSLEGYSYHLYDLAEIPIEEVTEQAESLLSEILPQIKFREFEDKMWEFINIMRERIESRKEYQFKYGIKVKSLIEQSYEASESPLHHVLLFFVNWNQWSEITFVELYESETQDEQEYDVNDNNNNDLAMTEAEPEVWRSTVTSIEEVLMKRKHCSIREDEDEIVQVKFGKTDSIYCS